MSDKAGDKLTKAESEVWLALSGYFIENVQIDSQTAGKIANKSVTSIKRYLKRFVEIGYLVSVGENKNRRYELKKLSSMR